MKIIVDISEDDYKYIKANGARIPYYRLTDAIKNGIPLPKGHGRLIDADELTESILCKTFGLRSVDIENAPTIVEADKAESEE